MTMPKVVDTSKLKDLIINKISILPTDLPINRVNIQGGVRNEHTPFNPFEDVYQQKSIASGVVNTRREHDWYRNEQVQNPLVITDHEWKLAKAKTENDKKRTCFNCSKQLNYQEYIIANPEISVLKLKEYWERKEVGMLCCSCKRVMEMLKGYKRDNPKLFEML